MYDTYTTTAQPQYVYIEIWKTRHLLVGTSAQHIHSHLQYRDIHCCCSI
jgi:hypothetical protein